MFDFAFDHRSLQREFHASDFKLMPALKIERFREDIVNRAISEAANGFTAFGLERSVLRGRNIYQVRLISHELVLRKLRRNISRLTRTRQADRGTIVRSLRALFAEGHNLRVYRLDVRQFYPSVDRNFIIKLFERDHGFPPSSLAVFRSWDACLTALKIDGLPQGLSISAVLAEYVMRHFDRAIKAHAAVHYFARFVDDMVVVTTGAENERDFLRLIRAQLPRGLELNYSKSRFVTLNRAKVNGVDKSTPEQSIDFLGYQFTIYGQSRTDQGQSRRVILDIAPRKVQRLKHRICLSALQYIKDSKYDDFVDRLKIISGNYNMYDHATKMRRNVGIYWNYREIDHSKSVALAELDRFLLKILLAQKGRICGSLWPALNDARRKELLAIKFSRSFNDTMFHHFNSKRLAELVACWTYE